MRMSGQITITLNIGPMVVLEAEGKNCEEIAEALKGWEKLNPQVEKLCTDLAERVYPEENNPSSESKGR
jgi:hypothetical protein